MSTPKDGGPAYPFVVPASASGLTQGRIFEGMTIRQAYKLAALQGLIAKYGSEDGHFHVGAKLAGRFADAMLAEDEEHAKK